ncbi:MAG: VTT domain-containing protein [Verrucomicrobiota bacterium]|nr:VTT domain-containing protein [Verrucomicrobiota bacterium]
MLSSRIKILIGLVAIGALVGTTIVWLFWDEILEIDVRAAVDRIAGFGPVTFFAAMAILPSLLAPVSPFLILAGAIYDMPLALLGSGLALSSNMAISWLVAGKWFRPLSERLVHRFGYTVPEMTKETMVTVAALLRITPGMPFPLQNYLLGLARMPFGWYMAVSLPLNLSIAFSVVWFGDALLKGNATMILLALSTIIALSFAVHQLRARLKRKSLDPEAG